MTGWPAPRRSGTARSRRPPAASPRGSTRTPPGPPSRYRRRRARGRCRVGRCAQPRRACQDLAHLIRRQGAVGIDERQSHLAIQRGVEGLPELQGGRTAVEHQQAVTAAGDAGAGDQVESSSGAVGDEFRRGGRLRRHSTEPQSHRRPDGEAWSLRPAGTAAGCPSGSSVTFGPFPIRSPVPRSGCFLATGYVTATPVVGESGVTDATAASRFAAAEAPPDGGQGRPGLRERGRPAAPRPRSAA